MSMVSLPTGSVTFLFTDVEGSTQFWEQEPERMQAALSRHDDVLRTAIEQHRGYVFSTGGDSFAAAFHTVAEAVAAAVEAQLTLARASPDGLQLAVRMALHTGEAEERGGDYFGPPLNRCARLLAVGHGGQILLTRATKELLADRLPDAVGLVDIGVHRLRDLSNPERVYQLTHPGLRHDFPPLVSMERVPNNLPVQRTSFITRERQQARIEGALAESRLVTLTGPGGSGKTRLALQAAADALEAHGDGVWFVDLAPISEPELVPKAVATSIGLAEQSSLDVATLVVDHLRRKNSLIVLDNCEHVVGAAAQIADQLLRNTEDVRLLVTSQETLRVPGEFVQPIPPMDAPTAEVSSLREVANYDAVRLFEDRAASVVPGFRVDEDNVAAVVEICRRLDGLPLALELAAARLSIFTPEEIAARLDERFALLTRGQRTAAARHQALLSAIDWSHDLLEHDERVLFRRLSVFVGDFDLTATEEVCFEDGNADGSALDTLSRLVDKSLLTVKTTDSGRRFRMLESIRAYARDRLLAAGEEQAFKDRHAEYFGDVSMRGRDGLLGPDAPHWFTRLAVEQDNIQAALDWTIEAGRTELMLRIAGAVGAHWLLSRRVAEGFWWLRRVAAASEGVESVDRVEVLGWAGSNGTVAAEQEESVGYADDAIELARRLSDPLALALAELHRGLVELDIERATALLRSAAEGIDQTESHWDLWTRAWLGYHLYMSGDFDVAEETLTRVIADAEERGELITQADASRYLGQLLEARGELAEASSRFGESLHIARKLGSAWAISGALADQARQHVARRDGDGALEYIEDAIELQPGNVLTLTGLYALLALARYWSSSDEDWPEALRESFEWTRVATRKGQVLALPIPLRIAATLAHEVGESELAATLHGVAHGVDSGIGMSVHLAFLVASEERTRAALEQERYDDLFEEGAAMDPLDGIALAEHVLLDTA